MMCGWQSQVIVAGDCRRCHRLRRPQLPLGIYGGASETLVLTISPRAPAVCYGSALNDGPSF